MLSVTFSKIILLVLTFHAAAGYSTLLYKQPASWSEMCFMEARQPGLLVGAMIWLGLRWLQSCWLQYTALSERARGREGEGVIESGIVSLSSCQEQCCIVLLSLGEVCVRVAEERRFKMNQLISKSTSEDINTNLLAVISTQESDTMLCENWPLWIASRRKRKRSRASGRLPFHKQRYRRQTLLTASALSWHCAREL